MNSTKTSLSQAPPLLQGNNTETHLTGKLEASFLECFPFFFFLQMVYKGVQI
jgi:hypothetical protein